MLGQRLDRDRPKGVEPDVQRDFDDLDAGCFDLLEQLGGEVQAGSREQPPSPDAGQTRFDTLAVAGHHLAGADVMREGHAAGQFQQFQVVPLGQDRLGDRPAGIRPPNPPWPPAPGRGPRAPGR